MAGDLVDVVVSALTAGAAAAAKDTASGAVKAAYGKLITALRERVGGVRSAELEGIVQASGDEETIRNRLTDLLADLDLASDDTLAVAAQAVLARTSAGKYVVDARDSQGVQIGDGNTMTLDFRSTDS